MSDLAVKIVKWVSSDQPGFVVAQVVDIHGIVHEFLDKVPIFTDEEIFQSSIYPIPGKIRCLVIEKAMSDDGRTIYKIDTSQPDGVESTKGTSTFWVDAGQLA